MKIRINLRCAWISFIILVLLAVPGYARAGEIVFEELVTVTEDGFAVAWDTAEPEPSVLYCGGSPDHLLPFEVPGAPATHHLVMIDVLAADELYFYSATPDWNPDADANPFSPGQVRTLKTPPGAFLFSFATVNDTHVGEDVAGLISIGDFSFTPGFTWDDPDNPHWLFTNEQAVRQINEADVDFVIHKGDVTSNAKEEEYDKALEIFGGLDAEIYYVRGNHDRVHGGVDQFKLSLGIETTHFFFDWNGVRFVVMDTSDPDGLTGQIDWLGGVMDEADGLGLRVMIFAHQTFALPGGLFWAVLPPDAHELTRLLSGYPGFAGMFAGHSHRAKVNFVEETNWVPYVETPAVKEYPMGYALVRVYDGGYTHSFFRTTCDECLEWASMTRGEYFGLSPWITMGSAEDRNFTIEYPDYTGPDDDANDDTAGDDSSSDDASGDDSTHDDGASGSGGDDAGCCG